MGISDPKSKEAVGSSKKLKNLPSKGSGFEDILKKKDIMPIPETHTACVQKASYKVIMIILWYAYIVVNLHFDIETSPIVAML